jgi:TonB family protein
VRLFLRAFVLALSCAAAAAAQSGRVKRPVPPPAPEPRREAAPRQQGGGRAVTGKAEDEAAETLRDEEGNRVYLGRQVDRKARLLSRPEPAYPRRARRADVQGTVVLRVVLAASGRVEKIAVLKGLPEGVTEEAIKAARQIRFVPAERDGRKVSQSAIIEYNFNLY